MVAGRQDTMSVKGAPLFIGYNEFTSLEQTTSAIGSALTVSYFG